MTDAWKGAHLISAKGIEARKATTLSLASRIAQAAAQSHADAAHWANTKIGGK